MVLDELFLDKIEFCRKKDILRLQTAVLTQKGMFVPYFVVLKQTITFILNSIFNISGTFNFSAVIYQIIFSKIPKDHKKF